MYVLCTLGLSSLQRWTQCIDLREGILMGYKISENKTTENTISENKLIENI